MQNTTWVTSEPEIERDKRNRKKEREKERKKDRKRDKERERERGEIKKKHMLDCFLSLYVFFEFHHGCHSYVLFGN